MKAVDTNVVIYAFIESSPRHQTAKNILAQLAEGPSPWALPWPCVYETLRVVTHPKVYHPPMPMQVAQSNLSALFQSPSLMLLSQTARHWEIFENLTTQATIRGNLVHDAHIAALCLEHRVSCLITGDEDFRKFPMLPMENPFRQA